MQEKRPAVGFNTYYGSHNKSPSGGTLSQHGGRQQEHEQASTDRDSCRYSPRNTQKQQQKTGRRQEQQHSEKTCSKPSQLANPTPQPLFAWTLANSAAFLPHAAVENTPSTACTRLRKDCNRKYKQKGRTRLALLLLLQRCCRCCSTGCETHTSHVQGL